jgi:hypothetical protein
MGISLAEYVRRLVERDLRSDRGHRDVSELFDLGDSGGSDVSTHKDAYLAVAVAERRGRAS